MESIMKGMTIQMVILALALLVANTYATPIKFETLAQSSARVDGDYRLPNNSVPTSYLIKLEPYIVVDNFTFNGEASIALYVLEPTSELTLHSNALNYSEGLTSLVSEAGVNYPVTSHTFNTLEQFLVLGFNTTLPVGNYTLNLTYVGILDSDMYGFYRSSYTSDSGDTVWLATTQFEPTSARRAFPCYDEPALKAAFDIRIKHDASLHALSNMPIVSNDTDQTDGKVWTIFQTTPLMSSYLIAFVVSDYATIQSLNGTFNVWARPNAISFAQYALDVGALELTDLEKYTNVSYALPKMDQISIPDFSAGAMENWGLVTYRESYFHLETNVSTVSTKQNIATVISHEFAHQWFGNLVSPLWWKYLWLNEGFATYFEFYTTDQVEDNWRLMEQFVIRVMQAVAFVNDASAESHPMNNEVSSPSEISANFDRIAYNKAGCVIRMMSHFLTEDVFKAGLTKYLNKHAYGAATSDDLFEALGESENETGILPYYVEVPDVMEGWVEQMGYPVVTVIRNYTSNIAVVSQERFLLGDADSTDTHDYKWWIPINWATTTSPIFNSTVASDWIRSQDDSIIISGFSADDWVIFNIQQTGYYRVNYDDTNWALIASYLKSENYENVDVLNRAQIVDDSLNLAKADRLSYSVAIDVIAYLEQEVDYIPWYPAFTGFTYLNRQLANTDNYESIRAFFALLTTKVYESVGVYESSDDAHTTLLNRINVIAYACNYGVQKCRSDAHDRVLSWLDDPVENALPSNLVTAVSCAGVRTANSTTWNRVWDLYKSSNESTVKTAILAALGCSEDEDIINDWLQTIISADSGLGTTTAASAFAYVYQGSHYNIDRAFDFIVNNLDAIISYFGSVSTVQTWLNGIGYRMTTQSQLDKLNTFATAQSGILGTAAQGGITYAVSNVNWTTSYESTITTRVLSALAEAGYTSSNYRLPNNSAPISYEVIISPYIEENNFTFDGNASIYLGVVEETSEITINSYELTYDEDLTTLVSEKGVTYSVTRHTFDTEAQFLTIGFNATLPVGNYTLNFTYAGIIHEGTVRKGIFRSSYVNASGDTVWLASTQFESAFARRAFPCYDEPGLKATFKISIKHDPSRHALSNMPIVSTTTDSSNGRILTVFDTTPLMPTYLVAFAISDFDSIQNTNGSFGVWARPNAIEHGQYAFDIGTLALAELAEYTSIPFALPKMDQIGIPMSSTGAMENWGLVTYGEGRFLWEENVTTTSLQQNVATVISHEFAHQWFGNLVGPNWWTDLWLNEGFATYFQYYITENIVDNWRLMEQFAVRALQATAFVTDASATSHPMNYYVSTPDEIAGTFDNIAYSKAACVIRMMANFLSEDVFRAGLTRYLNNMSYLSATSDDLFEALHEVEDEAGILPYHVYVPDIMEGWVTQMGYPVVTVTRNYTTGTTVISQARFLLGDADPTDTHEYRWWIPINWATEASSNFSSTLAQDWIRSQDESIVISGFTTSYWIIFNVQQTGYYRVNYDDTNWGMIANYLKSSDYEKIHVINRAQIVDDSLNLARGDLLSYSVALNVVAYLEQEIDYIPWYSAFNAFTYLNRQLTNTAEYESMRAFLALLTTKVYESVGVYESAEDAHTILLNRINAITNACKYGVQSCRTDTHNRVLSWLDDPVENALPSNLVTAVSCAGVRTANATTWNRVWNLYKSSNDSTVQTAILAALGCSEDENIINDWLQTIISADSGLDISAASSAFIYVYQGNHYNIELAFNFIVDNLDAIISYFGDVSYVETFLTGIGYRMTTQAELDKLNAFAEEQSATIGTAAAAGIVYAVSNVEWTATYEPEISAWVLNALASETSTSVSTGSTSTEVVETTTPSSSMTLVSMSYSILFTIVLFTGFIH